MREAVEERFRDLARRSGISGVPAPAIAAATVVLLVAVVLAMWRWWPRDDVEFVAAAGVRSDVARATESTGTGPSADATVDSGEDAAHSQARGPVTVHVVGAVLRPGVYTLPVTARVCDAVRIAGGPTGNAEPAAINLARVVTDGEQIVVPTQDEFRAGAALNSARPATADGSPLKGGDGAVKLNINTADATALDGLPGVGPATAARIVADREANGPFESPDDLGRVTGIGPKKLEQLKGSICVR